jgi:hypothetical protein
MRQNVLDKTLFLNVDLDIRSKSNLQPLVDAMGDKIIVMYVGRVKRYHQARLELDGSHRNAAGHKRSPEAIILGFCKVIGRLPPGARELWDDSKTREFDIGIESGKPYKFYWFDLSPKALQAALEVNAQIAVTIYWPMRRAKAPSKAHKAPSSK